jgi:hypothetical protein
MKAGTARVWRHGSILVNPAKRASPIRQQYVGSRARHTGRRMETQSPMSPKNSPKTVRPPQPVDFRAAERMGAPHPYRVSHTETRPDVIARLEWLDDLMFAAIDGDNVALEAAVHAWQRTVEELGAEAVEESRRQYMRRAQSVWDGLRQQADPPPHKTFAAIEIISLLADRSW